MANKNLFGSIAGKLLPKPDAINEARGRLTRWARSMRWRSTSRPGA